MHKAKTSLDKALRICDSKTYVFKAYNDFSDYDMSEIVIKGLSRYASNIKVKWNKKDNAYSVSADVISKNEFESMIEGTIVFKSWISR